MTSLPTAFEAYRRLDLDGWVAVYKVLPLWAGVLCVVGGALMVFLGGGRLFRVVAAPLGAFVGLVWGGALATRFGFTANLEQTVLIIAGMLGLVGLLVPPALSFVALGIPCGLIGGQLAGPSDFLLGFVPGCVVGGAIGVMAHRIISGLVSSAAGGWALTLGALACLAPSVSAIDALGKNSLVVLGVATLFTLAGVTYQLFIRPPPEVREKRKQDKFMAKKWQTEKNELEARWTKKSPR